MARSIRITSGQLQVDAQLNDTATADMVWQALPVTASASTWGDEIYFGIPVHTEVEQGGQEVVDMGDLGYWPPGHAFCVFFGPTPASRGEEIRPASAVTVIGKVLGDAAAFKQVSSGSSITVEALDG